MKCMSRQMPFHNLEMTDTKRINKKYNGQKIQLNRSAEKNVNVTVLMRHGRNI